jgi:DNA-binding NtrC family response regulator
MALTESSILIIDDNDEIRESLQLFLGRHFSKIVSLSSPNSIIREIETSNFDVILLDMNFSGGKYSGNEGLFWLKEILKRDPELVVVLITAYGKVDLAVNGIKEGAFDFLLKPWDNEKLLTTIKAGIKLRKSQTEVTELKQKQQFVAHSELTENLYLQGKSAAMKEIDTIIKKVAATDANILILGENGTGKEIVAREIHNRSQRNNQLFMSIDLSSLSETLFESELFGYKKGAFTDAKDDRMGKIEAANHGTLFLDEIGNLPLNLQSKLLTVLQTKTITRLGSTQSKKIDFRLLCATNKSLPGLIKEGLFREDLFFRINTVQIEIPSLRERKEDILPFSEYFLNIYDKKYNKRHSLTKSAILKLEKYQWPGNIRELKHAMERAVILSNIDKINADDFAFMEFNEVKSNDAILNLLELEQIAIKKAIKKAGGNMSKAAEMLGVSRTTLYFKLSKYGL